MSKTIWKFQLSVAGPAFVDMPRGAEILHIGTQGDEPMIWAKVDPSVPTVARMFMTFGTDHEIGDDSNLRFIGTWMSHGGALVFHTFEVIDQ